MLVLSRKATEKIIIKTGQNGDGAHIVITVLKIKDGYVSIGIDAPDEFDIIRAELEKKEPKCTSESVTAKDRAALEVALSKQKEPSST